MYVHMYNVSSVHTYAYAYTYMCTCTDSHTDVFT